MVRYYIQNKSIYVLFMRDLHVLGYNSLTSIALYRGGALFYLEIVTRVGMCLYLGGAAVFSVA